MWANDVDSSEYADRLTDLAESIPGRTTYEALDR